VTEVVESKDFAGRKCFPREELRSIQVGGESETAPIDVEGKRELGKKPLCKGTAIWGWRGNVMKGRGEQFPYTWRR